MGLAKQVETQVLHAHAHTHDCVSLCVCVCVVRSRFGVPRGPLILPNRVYCFCPPRFAEFGQWATKMETRTCVRENSHPSPHPLSHPLKQRVSYPTATTRGRTSARRRCVNVFVRWPCRLARFAAAFPWFFGMQLGGFRKRASP